MRTLISTLLLCLPAATSLANQRVAIVVGNNHGDASRKDLAYAESDAERMAEVLGSAGRAEIISLLGQDASRLHTELRKLRDRIAKSPAATTVFFYYSGHGEHTGLVMNDTTYPGENLREDLEGIGATLMVAILDACSSADVAGERGGTPEPDFQISGNEDSEQAEGILYITSGGPGAASFESEDLKGGYFTDALVSGLRGPADVTGDGVVAIWEAFEWARSKTMLETRHHIQQQTPRLRFAEDTSTNGRVPFTFLSDSKGKLVLPAEEQATYFVTRVLTGRRVATIPPDASKVLSIDPGRYLIDRIRGEKIATLRVEVTADAPRTIANAEFTRLKTRSYVQRGGAMQAELHDDRESRLRVGARYQLRSPGVEDAPLTHGYQVELTLQTESFAFGLSHDLSNSFDYVGNGAETVVDSYGGSLFARTRGYFSGGVGWIGGIELGGGLIRQERPGPPVTINERAWLVGALDPDGQGFATSPYGRADVHAGLTLRLMGDLGLQLLTRGGVHVTETLAGLTFSPLLAAELGLTYAF